MKNNTVTFFMMILVGIVFGVSRSGYYAWLKHPISSQNNREEKLIKQIRNEYLQSNQIYGSPKITKELQKQGVCVSQKNNSSFDAARRPSIYYSTKI